MKKIYIMKNIQSKEIAPCLALNETEAQFLAGGKDWIKLAEHSVEDYSKNESLYNQIYRRAK